MEGWISLHRSVQEHWLWKNPVKLQWWLDILLNVNHKDKKVNIGNDLIDCDRGQSIMSLQNWGKRWDVSKDTVRNFLKLLQKDNMILLENLSKTTRLTVCNYDKYQPQIHDDQTQSKRNPNANQTQSYPNNNVNKDKNDNNNYKKVLLSELKNSDVPNQEYFEITLAYWQLFKKNLIESGVSTTTIEKAKGKWIDPIRLLIEQDKHTLQDLRDVFQLLQNDEFWKSNILSTSKLRIQFQKLLLKARNNGKQSGYQKGATDKQLAEVMLKHFG